MIEQEFTLYYLPVKNILSALIISRLVKHLVKHTFYNILLTLSLNNLSSITPYIKAQKITKIHAI